MERSVEEQELAVRNPKASRWREEVRDERAWLLQDDVEGYEVQDRIREWQDGGMGIEKGSEGAQLSRWMVLDRSMTVESGMPDLL